MSGDSERWPTEAQLEEQRTLEYDELYEEWLSDPEGFLDGFGNDTQVPDMKNLKFNDKLPFP